MVKLGGGCLLPVTMKGEPMTNKRRLEDVRIDSVSIVAAPTCEACGEPMKGADSFRWRCVNSKCDRSCQPVDVPNVYPFKIVKERLELELEGKGETDG